MAIIPNIRHRSAEPPNPLKSLKPEFDFVQNGAEKNESTDKEAIDQIQFTTQEVSVILKVSAQTIVNYCDRQWIKCTRLSDRSPRIISREDLIAFMRSRQLAVPNNFYEVLKGRK